MGAPLELSNHQQVYATFLCNCIGEQRSLSERKACPVQMVTEPGQSWLNFQFDTAAIMQSMAMPLTV